MQDGRARSALRAFSTRYAAPQHASIGSAHRKRSERIDVGDHVDDDRALRRERLRERRSDVAGLLDANPQRAHLLGDAREIHLAEGPQLLGLLGLRAAIDAVETALGLIAARIVVDHRDRIDAPARRRLDLRNVVPKPGIAGEGDHRPLGATAFCAETGGKGPAEMAGATDVALARTS